MPTTEQRRNVTKRRSSGRARDSLDSTSVPVSSLLSQTRKKDKDGEYLQEHIQTPNHAQDNARRMPSGAERSTSSILDGCNVPDFTRRQIPNKDNASDLHEQLTSMWIRKKTLEVDIKDAVEDGDKDNLRHQKLVDQHSNINRLMFTVLHSNLDGSEKQAPPRMPSAIKQSQSLNTKVGFKEDDAPFVIYFEYKEEEIPTVVWTHIPVAMLSVPFCSAQKLR
jgi:hypothetical protein